MSDNYFTDPTASHAIGAAMRAQKRARHDEQPSTEQVVDSFVGFALRSVLSETPEKRLDAVVKRLGTFAQSNEVTDAQVRHFCRRLEEQTDGRYDREQTYNLYERFRAYFANGGPNNPSLFIMPLIDKYVVTY